MALNVMLLNLNQPKVIFLMKTLFSHFNLSIVVSADWNVLCFGCFVDIIRGVFFVFK